MVRKVYEVDPMLCPKCRTRMKAIAFLGLLSPPCYFELSLTSNDATIYHSQRWDEAKSELWMLVKPYSKKQNSYNLRQFPLGGCYGQEGIC